MPLSKILSDSLASGVGQGVYETALLHVVNQQATATGGGGSTSGSFIKLPYNTVKTNEITGASLSSNQVTLPSGTYYLQANCRLYRANEFKMVLRNTTDSNQYITLNDVLNTCGTRDIKVNMNSISELQEKCCGENCVVELNRTQYSTLYNYDTRLYHENCQYWCKDEIPDEEIRCNHDSCSGCPECIDNELSD